MIHYKNILAFLGVTFALCHGEDTTECGAYKGTPCYDADGVAFCSEPKYVPSLTSAEPLCVKCGFWGQLPCPEEAYFTDPDGTTTHPCYNGLALWTEDSVEKCTSCGTNNKPICVYSNENPCDLGYYQSDNICLLCGYEGRNICEDMERQCQPGYTPDPTNEGKTCTRCGTNGKPRCTNVNEAECYIGLAYDSDEEACVYCGYSGKVSCANTCEPCKSGLVEGDDGKCTRCGYSNQPWCTNLGEDFCNPGYTPSEDHTCLTCGYSNTPQCGIVGTYIAEMWTDDGESSVETYDLFLNVMHFTKVNDENYRVTKYSSTEWVDLGETNWDTLLESKIVELDFEFPFYDKVYTKVCVSTQGHIVMVEDGTTEVPDSCKAVDKSTVIDLELHYSAPRISFMFDHWTDPSDHSTMRIRKSKNESNPFLNIVYVNSIDESNTNDLVSNNVAQNQLVITPQGDFYIYGRWGRSKDGVVGVSPGTIPPSYAEVNFSEEFCRSGLTPKSDGTCTSCGGRNQPPCLNQVGAKLCKNRYTYDTVSKVCVSA